MRMALRGRRLAVATGVVGAVAATGAALAMLWQDDAPSAAVVAPAGAAADIVARGRIEPGSRVLVLQSPSGGGVVKELRVREGQEVRHGDVVAVLEGYDAQAAAVRVAERSLEYGRLARAQSLAAAKQSDIAAQENVVELRRAALQRAQGELARQRQLRAQQMVSAQALDLAMADQRQAEAALAQAEHVLAGLREVRGVDRAALDAKVAVDQAALEKARADLEGLVVRSPIDGTVLALVSRPGEAVAAGGVVRLANLRGLVVIADVDEAEVGAIDRTRAGTVHAPFLQRPVRAAVRYVNPEIFRQDRGHSDALLGRDARIVQVELAPQEDLPPLLGGEVTVRFPRVR